MLRHSNQRRILWAKVSLCLGVRREEGTNFWWLRLQEEREWVDLGSRKSNGIWEGRTETHKQKFEWNSKSQWNKASGSHSPQLTAPTGDLARKIFWDLAYALGVNGLIGLENKSPQHSWKQGPQQNILKLKDEEQSCQDFNYIWESAALPWACQPAKLQRVADEWNPEGGGGGKERSRLPRRGCQLRGPHSVTEAEPCERL